MINGKKVLAIITARGNSKGLPRKNIKPLANKPLLAWTIEAAAKSKFIDRLILSTDDKSIADIADSYNCEVPFIRPENLAQDNTPSIDVVLHAIDTLEKKYDYVVLLQPTSPFRSTDDIDTCIMESNLHEQACVSGSAPAKSPFWMYFKTENGNLLPLLRTEAIRRQDLPEVFALNGAVYVAPITFLKKNKTFLTHKTIGYYMPKMRSVDIDDAVDFAFCEMLLEKGFIDG